VASPGPEELGRGVVVLPGQQPPAPWASVPKVLLGQPSSRSRRPWSRPSTGRGWPAGAWWWSSRPIPGRCGRPSAASSPSTRSSRRSSSPRAPAVPRLGQQLRRARWRAIWWHGRKAARRLGSDGVTQGGEADVTLADGTPSSSTAARPTHRPSLGSRRRPPMERRRRAPRSGGQRPPAAELAPDQLAAVGHRSGAVRVIAPAGSARRGC